jgi:hypothetical protein
MANEGMQVKNAAVGNIAAQAFCTLLDFFSPATVIAFDTVNNNAAKIQQSSCGPVKMGGKKTKNATRRAILRERREKHEKKAAKKAQNKVQHTVDSTAVKAEEEPPATTSPPSTPRAADSVRVLSSVDLSGKKAKVRYSLMLLHRCVLSASVQNFTLTDARNSAASAAETISFGSSRNR